MDGFGKKDPNVENINYVEFKLTGKLATTSKIPMSNTTTFSTDKWKERGKGAEDHSIKAMSRFQVEVYKP